MSPCLSVCLCPVPDTLSVEVTQLYRKGERLTESARAHMKENTAHSFTSESRKPQLAFPKKSVCKVCKHVLALLKSIGAEGPSRSGWSSRLAPARSRVPQALYACRPTCIGPISLQQALVYRAKGRQTLLKAGALSSPSLCHGSSSELGVAAFPQKGNLALARQRSHFAASSQRCMSRYMLFFVTNKI